LDSEHLNIDPDRFGQLALSIAKGNGFVYEAGGKPVLERTPLYSYLVASLFKLTDGFSLSAVQVMQAVFHALTSIAVFLLAGKIVERRAALLAQILYVLHPVAMWYTARIWVETTYTLLLTLFSLTFLILFQKPSTKRAIGSGVLLGLCCLTKPVLLLFPLVYMLMLFIQAKTYELKYSVILLLLMSAVVFPWSVRNHAVSNSFVPVNTSLGFNLIQGDAIGRDWPSREKGVVDYWKIAKRRTDSLLAPLQQSWESAESDKLLIKEAIAGSLQDPAFFLKRIFSNFCTFWYLSESNAKSFVVGGLQVMLLLCSILSYIRMSEQQQRGSQPVVAISSYLIIANVLVVGWARYSMPLIPLLLVVSASLIERAISRKN
jgi:4-amino-4-deoxy-L-arabinose transferase-like glycosyltransferase